MTTYFRKVKSELLQLLHEKNWQVLLQQKITSYQSAKQYVSPLLAMLNRHEERWQAIWALGLAVSVIANESMESARVIMRRLMWSLNEESGNLGWGIPEAIGSILAQSPPLAHEYANILFSYSFDTGREDNFIDYAPLRRGAVWAMGYFAAHQPQTARKFLPILLARLHDEDAVCRQCAVWSLDQFCRAFLVGKLTLTPDEKDMLQQGVPAVTTITGSSLDIFDGEQVTTISAEELQQAALGSLTSVLH